MLSSLKEPEDDRLFPRTKARRWIVASHVCKRWREIVLDHATAWAEHVFSFSEEYVQSIILKRAGTAPLTFRYYDREQNEDEERRFNLVLQHIHQIARLDVLLFQPTRATTLFQALCSNSLPVLEELVIDYAPPSMDNPLFFFWTGPSFVAPQLRKCTLLDCYLQSWNVPSLEDLELRTARGRKSPGFPSFAQFLKSLRSSPNIRRLRTSSYIPSADAELHHPVHLPLLEKMDITDSTLDRIPALLSYLRLPSSCRRIWRTTMAVGGFVGPYPQASHLNASS
ncbi:hypothetical protein OF83DRAFT_718319 [Amylostereum chailletii]|nr:hypothetical protein OF83DRAFT_718319 [Amylostereum chailletii]